MRRIQINPDNSLFLLVPLLAILAIIRELVDPSTEAMRGNHEKMREDIRQHGLGMERRREEAETALKGAQIRFKSEPQFGLHQDEMQNQKRDSGLTGTSSEGTP